MKSTNTSNDVYIKVNDIFDELSDENKRLKNELMFANNCLNVFNKFKILLKNVFIKYETNIETKDKQNLDQLEEEFDSIIKSIEEFNTSNVKTEDIFEIETNDENVINSEDNQELNQLEEEFNSIKETEEQLKETNVLIDDNIIEFNGNINENYDDLDYELSEKSLSGNESNESSTISNQSYKRIDSQIGRKRSKRFSTRSKSKTKTKDNLRQKPEEESNSLKFLQTNNTFDSTTQRYVCPYPSCDKSYSLRHNLKHHFRQIHEPNVVHSEPKLFGCDFPGCDYQGIKWSLKVHKLKHSDIRPFQCNICKKCFKHIQSLTTHQRIMHNPGKFTCDYKGCNQRFKRRAHLEVHVQQKHTFVKPFKCTECEKAFVMKCHLKQHKKEVHSVVPFECEECLKVFKCLRNLISHKRFIHSTNQKTYSCDYCDHRCVRSQNLKRHIQIKHIIKEKTVKCDFEGCPKMFKDMTLMKKHKRECHSMKESIRVVCDWPGCGQTFKNKSTLKSHKRTHLGKKEFVCDIEGCGKAFFLRNTLSQHKICHIKRFVCSWPQCGQRFGRKYSLNKHMNRHLSVVSMDVQKNTSVD